MAHRLWRCGLWSYLAMFLACSVLLCNAGEALAKTRVHEGQVLEGFGLKRLVEVPGESRFVYLDDYLGETPKHPMKLMLLGFFASWCKPCLHEWPHIQRIEAAYREQGLAVVMINIDREADGVQAAQAFLDTQKPSFPVLSDRMNIVARKCFDEELNLPAIFLLDPEARIKAIFTGSTPDSVHNLETVIRAELGLGPFGSGNAARATASESAPAVERKTEAAQVEPAFSAPAETKPAEEPVPSSQEPTPNPAAGTLPLPSSAEPSTADSADSEGMSISEPVARSKNKPAGREILRFPISKVTGRNAWIDAGKRHGVTKDLSCRVLMKTDEETECSVVRVVDYITRLSVGEKVAKGDTVVFYRGEKP